MNIILFEDEGWEDLQPISLTRPLWDIRCGIFTLKERVEALFPENDISYICRGHIATLVKRNESNAGVNNFRCSDLLFLNARVIWNNIRIFDDLLANTEFYLEDKFVGGLLKGAFQIEGDEWSVGNTAQSLFEILKFKERMCGLFKREVHSSILRYPWDIVECNKQQISIDLGLIKDKRELRQEDFANSGVHIVSGYGVFTDGKVNIAPGVVLDSSEGPIFLGDGVSIMPNAVIQGPASIGRNSIIKIGAKIYQGTSIGPVCKVGGEVEETVIQGYSNKQHEGFLGHSYVGEWCNIGAGTENSDLKNNYTEVKVQIGERRVNSGRLFVGLFMGDHCKTGINTTFNTGTVMGPCSMAFGAGFQPRYIPSFSWSDGKKLIRANFDRTIKTAEIVMKRRDKSMGEEEIKLLKHIFDEYS